MKKVSLLLAIILLLSAPLMVACKRQVPPDVPPVTTPEKTTPPVEDAPVVHASISVEQLAERYEIIYAKDSSKEVKEETNKLSTAVFDAFEIILSQRTDLFYEGVASLAKGQYEILIGNTNREETATFLADLKWNDYGYSMVGDKLVIAGKNEDGTLAALRAFLEHFEKNESNDLFFNNADQFIFRASYPHNSITINGISANDLSIVCNEQALGGVAQIIRDAIIEACGIAVPIVTDDEIESLENVILIGQTDQVIDPVPDGAVYSTGKEFYINMLVGGIFIDAATTAGYLSAAAMIAEQISTSQTEAVTLEYKQYEGEDAIAVMSFNLMAGKEDKRLDSVVETILKYRPAVVGVQEATDMWIGLLTQRLGDIYTIVGEGRNADGGDEHSAILYLTAEFDCLESGTKWLSDTPDVKGSKFEKSHYTRIMTYALLSRKSDGKQLLHVNTHLDYGSTDAEETVKVAQMQVLFDEIARFSGIPTVITGDFNATVGSPVYQMVTGAGYIESADHIAAADRAPTYHALMATTGAPSHIDFVFHKDMGDDIYYRICNERVENENVSDHYPIFAILTFEPNAK